jgi:hypothetical protein
MSNQVLEGNVKKILTDAPITRINFELIGLRVISTSYKLVLDAIQARKISCDVDVTPNPNLPTGVRRVCRYEPASHQLLFPNDHYGSTSGSEKVNIVHEATHAMFDCIYGTRLGTQILAINDEAAAWLAQAVYFRKSPLLFWDGGPIVQGDPLEEAFKLVDKMVQSLGAFGSNGVTQSVPPTDAIPLQHSVATLYNFVGGAAGIKHVYFGV